MDPGEAEGFEPARGAWTHVSETVPAVHDDIPAGVELLGGFGVELFERYVDRGGTVKLFVLLARENLYQLRAVGEQAPQFVEIDR